MDVSLIAKLVTFGGIALIAWAFAPVGQGRVGLLRRPWSLAIGILVFVLGSLIEVAHMTMTQVR